MPGLGQGWTAPPSSMAFRKFTITPKGYEGAGPGGRASNTPFIPSPGLAEPQILIFPRAVSLRPLVDMNGFGQMCMNLSWSSPCDSERPITHLSKLMPSPVPLSHLDVITASTSHPSLPITSPPRPRPHSPQPPPLTLGWGTGIRTSQLAREEKGSGSPHPRCVFEQTAVMGPMFDN